MHESIQPPIAGQAELPPADEFEQLDADEIHMRRYAAALAEAEAPLP